MCALLLCRVQLFCDPVDCSPPGSSVQDISQARILDWVLQGIILTQGLNPHLLHCRQILYPLSHQGILCDDNIYFIDSLRTLKEVIYVKP